MKPATTASDSDVDDRPVTLPTIVVPELEHAAPSPSVELADFHRCGRYVLIERLGEGGAGIVFAAYDPVLDRKVALKVLKLGSFDAEINGRTVVLERFAREARALARIPHPNIVNVYDAGESEGRSFIAMEFVEGVTLGAWLKQERRSWREIRDMFVLAAQGLAVAHRAEIVHRDFKPQNVMVDTRGVPRVLDFGLAKSLASSTGSEELASHRPPDVPSVPIDSPLTREGFVMGTPVFMAPEQFDSRRRVGPRADQFAFCVSLWRALYRQAPFAGHDMKTLRESIVAGALQRPRDTAGVPVWIRDALSRGLRPGPDDRHPDMDALIAALTKDRRQRRRTTLAIGLAAMLSAGIAIGSWRIGQVTSSAAELDEIAELVGEARLAASRANFVYPPPEQPSAKTALAKVLELEARVEELGDSASAAALELRHEFAETLTRTGDRFWDREGGRAFAVDFYAMALLFDPQAERATQRSSLTPGELAEFRRKGETLDFTDVELESGALLSALAEPEPERRRAAISALRDSPSRSRFEARLLDALEGEAGTQPVASPPEPEPEPTATPLPAAQPEVEPVSAPTRTSDQAVDDLLRAGRAAAAKGDWAAAESALKRVVALDRGLASGHYELARVYFDTGRYEDAVVHARRAVALAPRRGGYLILLGDASFKVFDYRGAKEAYAKALERGDERAAQRLAKIEAFVPN